MYLIGICGTGMGSFAGLLKSAGYPVRGSDQATYPPMSDKLASWDIPVLTPYQPSNLDPAPDQVVVGNAIRREHPEAAAARERGLPMTSFPAALSELFLKDRHPVVVAGTHGKTTTTSLVAHLLVQGGKDPGFLIGGVPNNFGEGFRVGGPPTPSRPFVVEGDEYDTAYFDKGPKFLHYRPRTLILTSLEFDHADMYPDLEAIRGRFAELVALVPADGLILAAADAPHLPLEHARAPVVRYGLEAGHRPALQVRLGPQGAEFEGTLHGQRTQIHLPMAGRVNVMNGWAAALVAESFGISNEDIRAGLASFAGVQRRQTLRAEVDGVRIIDDFAHHPTAVAATLEGLKARHPDGRLWAIFEPRTATSARRHFQQAYVSAFDPADQVVVAGVGRPELPAEERLDVERLAQEVNARGVPARHVGEVEAIVRLLAQETAPGDTLVFMSNGGFGGILAQMEQALEARRRKGLPPS